MPRPRTEVTRWPPTLQENNPKAYVDERFDKTKQPKGDPDCKLGCKRRHNRGDANGDDPADPEPAAPTPATTPGSNPLPASQAVSVGEYYWGYASGVVTTKVPGWAEVVHERGKYVCPLRFPPTDPAASPRTAPLAGQVCPVNHANWPKGGCTAMMPTCAGARIRYQLDRTTDEYKEVYKQRTADERSNSQAKELGIERPRLRRSSAIANQNTLIYVLINLRAVQRIQAHKAELARQTQPDL